MSGRPRVEIYCDGSAKVGYGHIHRCRTLATQLDRDGVDVCILGLSDEARRLLPEPKRTGRLASVQVFDSPCNIDDMLHAAQLRGQITVALDWFGEVIPDVNIAVYPHGEVRGIKKVHIGFEYILLRDEIVLRRQLPATHSAKCVLVVLGGGDLLNQGHELSRRLCEQGLEVTLVQGPFAKNRDAGDGYRVLINPTELPQLLASCDWAVTNGGGCLFEAMCLRKAAYVFPQTEAEENIAHFAETRGAILGVGSANLRAFSYAELGVAAERGANLVDGLGGSRVSSIIRGLI